MGCSLGVRATRPSAHWVPYAGQVAQIAAGMRDPSTSTIARRAHSVRRTSNMDMLFSDDGRLALLGGARDLRTGAGGASEVLAAAQVRAVLGRTRQLEALDVAPAADTDELLGLPVSAGFRAAVDRV